MTLTPTWFILTPLSLTSLVLLLLTVAFLVFLVQRRPYTPAGRWLLGHETSLALFLTAHLLVISTFLHVWYPVMYLSFAAGMACLLQFALDFPRPFSRPTAARWMGAASGISIATEFFLAFQFWLAPQNENALALRTVGVGLGLWQSLAALFVLAYQAVRLEEAGRPAWLSLLVPRAAESRAARNMLFFTLAIVGLAATTFVYRLYLQAFVAETFFNIAWNISLMLLLSLFSITYLTSSPEPISFQVKLISITLTAVLISIWLLSLVYPFQLQIDYDLALQDDTQAVQAQLASETGLRADSIPANVAFVADCSSDKADLLFLRQTSLDLSHLCSDDFLSGSLYGSGSLDARFLTRKFVEDGKRHIVGFSYAGYIATMNQFSLPIALVMLGSTLAVMLLLPLVFYGSLIRPLGAVLNGLQQVNQGRLDVSVPVRSNDEIGLLASSFNAMAAELRDTVMSLENQVAESLKAEKSLREQQEQLRMLSARLAEVEEAERRKLGRELHDQAGQNLTALSLNLKLIRNQITAGALDPASASQLAERLNDASDLVRETTQRIRNVMEDLQPPALEEFGLAAALSWYATRFTARTGIDVEVFTSDPSPRKSPQVEIALFRIAQEALTNVARHAQATRVEIQLDLNDDAARMVIHDNGLGFAANQPGGENRAHWGVRIMAERAESIGGTCRVESVPNEGVKVLVEVQA
jgi:signal transduction histidine kinase